MLLSQRSLIALHSNRSCSAYSLQAFGPFNSSINHLTLTVEIISDQFAYCVLYSGSMRPGSYADFNSCTTSFATADDSAHTLRRQDNIRSFLEPHSTHCAKSLLASAVCPDVTPMFFLAMYTGVRLVSPMFSGNISTVITFHTRSIIPNKI